MNYALASFSVCTRTILYSEYSILPSWAGQISLILQISVQKILAPQSFLPVSPLHLCFYLHLSLGVHHISPCCWIPWVPVMHVSSQKGLGPDSFGFDSPHHSVKAFCSIRVEEIKPSPLLLFLCKCCQHCNKQLLLNIPILLMKDTRHWLRDGCLWRGLF